VWKLIIVPNAAVFGLTAVNLRKLSKGLLQRTCHPSQALAILTTTAIKIGIMKIMTIQIMMITGTPATIDSQGNGIFFRISSIFKGAGVFLNFDPILSGKDKR